MEVIFATDKKVAEASKGYRLSIESVLQQGFNLFRKAPAELITFSILAIIIFSNPLTGLLLGGPVLASFYHMAHLIRRDQQIEFTDFFRGFEKTGSLLALNLMIFLVVLLGLILFILPGIYLIVSYLFSTHFVWFHDREPAEALKLSRLTVSGNFGQILLILLILGGINLLGILALGVGILLTLPFSFCVIYSAFDDIIGISN